MTPRSKRSHSSARSGNEGSGTDEVDTEQPYQSKVWIAWSFGAAIFFTACNEAIAEITQ